MSEPLHVPMGRPDAIAEPPSAPHALTRILGRAPFGMEIVSSGGQTVYVNEAAAAMRSLEGIARHDLPNDRVVRTESFDIEADAQTYCVTLAFDHTEQSMAEQDLLRRAYFDELTGLPNRALIERSVDTLIEGGAGQFALAFIDLDGFKHVNDYYGHAVGDKLLTKLAERLSASLRETDMLARLSGDEFVLLVSPVASMEQSAEDIAWISDRIKEPFFIDGHEIFTSASIGVSMHPEGGVCYDVLRSNADRAMYRGKGDAKGSIRFFDESIEHAAVERSRLEQRLRLAIRDRRVCCAYQPKVDLRTNEIAGVEVLMRWKDEDGVIQPPGQFLALATELGLMDDLTHFILSDVVRSIDRIGEAFGPNCSISINVAARQAGDVRFMRTLVEELDATGFAERFMLELTEEAFLAKAEFQRIILPMIREAGSRVSIDDFGTGYSSLAALADITADELKIDRSFITEVHKRPRSQGILKAIEALGHSLGMSIIVEGVETFEELAYLQAATRIKYAQGHYFAKPMLLEEVHNSDAAKLDLRATPSPRAMSLGRSTLLCARSS